MKRLLTIIAAITLFYGIGRAQQFPVQVTPQLLPPYSVKVSDYYSPGTAGTKLNLLLLLRDFNKPQLQVRLRMSIEGQSVAIRTREDAVFTPITIESGTPVYVDPSELAQYFNPDNLDFSGITRQQYEQTGKLPEGFYTFCFEAIETATNQSVSNKGCTFAWMTLNEPPILNLPRKAEGVIPINPQNIIFQWTPRHTASPTAAFVTDYIFSIVEMNDNAIAPEAAFLSNLPLYVDSVTTTTFLYHAGLPALIEGKKYAWRVQAKAKNGIQDLATFRNQGYSETFWFTYQNNCVVPAGVTASPQGQRVGIEWQQNPAHLEYKVEYREANNADAAWFEIGNTLPRVSITDLKPNTTYEYRVGGACEYGRYTFGNLLQFTTNGENATTVPECGVDPNLTDPPQTLLQQFSAGDTIHAGDYDVMVTQVTGQTSFSGEGYVKMSWLGDANIAVRFTNIGINTEKKLASGVIETTYDSTMVGIADVDEIVEDFISVGTAIIDLIKINIDRDYKEIKKLMEQIRLIAEQELPQELRDRMNSALAVMDNAKQDYDKAKTLYDSLPDGPEKQAALQQMGDAKQKFEDAKKEVEKINGEKEKLVRNVTTLIVKAIKELKLDYEQKKPNAKTELNTSKSEILNEVYTSQGISQSTTTDVFDRGGYDLELTPDAVPDELRQFAEKAKTYNDKKRLLTVIQQIFALHDYYSDPYNANKKIPEDNVIDGRVLIRNVMEMKSKTVSDAEILAEIKNFLLQKLNSIK